MTRTTRWVVAAIMVVLCAAGGGLPQLTSKSVVEAQGANRLVTHEDLTVTNGSAIGLTTTTFSPSVNGRTRPIAACRGRVETTTTRFRYDGTAPTTAVGSYYNADDSFDITRWEDAAAYLFISTGANSTVHVDCWTQ